MKNFKLLLLPLLCLFMVDINAQSDRIKAKDSDETIIQTPPVSENNTKGSPRPTTTRSFVAGYALDLEDDFETAKFGGVGSSTYLDFFTSANSSYLASLELSDDLYLGTSSNLPSGNFYLRTVGSNRMTLDNMGNIGVGTTTPDTKFHVNDGDIKIQDTYPGLFFHNTTNDLLGEVHVNTSDDLEIEAQVGNLIFQTVDFTRMIINDAGNVGIGTTSIPSGYRLAVDGNAICEEVWVKNSTNWPDYVFKKRL